MDLEEQIYHRKSCRHYLDDDIDRTVIDEFMENVKPLNEDINYYYEIYDKNQIKLRTNWSAPYYLALFSQKNENYLENIGFVFQQLSLYLQSLEIGSCWVGMASLKDDNPEFVIMIAFGKSDNLTRDLNKFRRKKLSDISDISDDRLIPAQLAPSAINSQPWYFKHTDDGFDVFQVKQNFLKRKIIGKWNPIDVGIALAHLYVANKSTFKFYKKSNFDNIKGYYYIGSIKI